MNAVATEKFMMEKKDQKVLKEKLDVQVTMAEEDSRENEVPSVRIFKKS